jgi:hypothetical protein
MLQQTRKIRKGAKKKIGSARSIFAFAYCPLLDFFANGKGKRTDDDIFICSEHDRSKKNDAAKNLTREVLQLLRLVLQLNLSVPNICKEHVLAA